MYYLMISERVAIDEPTLIPAAREADNYVLLSLYVFAQNSKHTIHIIVYSALQGLVYFFFFFFFFFSMKVYAKEAQGIQNSIKLMLLHPGVSISNDTQTQKDKHGYNTDSNVLLWYSYTIKLSKWSK